MAEETGKRFLLVRQLDGSITRIDITNCFWCADAEDLCGVCAAKAEQARKEGTKS